MAWVQADREVQDEPELGKVLVLSEEVINDSDKSLVYSTDIAEGSRLMVTAIRVELVTTATIGTRIIEVQILDSGSDIVRKLEFNATLAASLSTSWDASPNVPVTAGTNVNYEILPSFFYLLAGQTLRIFDSAAVDAAADDMVVHVTGLLQ